MLLYLRKEISQGETYPDQRSRSFVETIAFKFWRASVSRPTMLKLANLLGRLIQAPFARAGRLGRLPPPLSGWTRYRNFPALASRPFRDRWRGMIRK
jgi:L-lactate dehydrogenase complex protein LldF